MMGIFPSETGPIHFVGIGGIGMSGIARILHDLGCQVSGSDRAQSVNVKRLQDLGLKITIGHDVDKSHPLWQAGVVVTSTAIAGDNPEVQAARQHHIPVIARSEMLAEIMRLKQSIAVGGSHGKTTTTSMIGTIFDQAQYDPTVIIGGIVNRWHSNARLGQGPWLIAEADESDGSFLRLPAMMSIVTNIDREHMDYYKSDQHLADAFYQFATAVPFYGHSIVCIDKPQTQALAARMRDHRVITCGTNPQSDIRALNVQFFDDKTTFVLEIAQHVQRDGSGIKISLPLLGVHNVCNALAAIATALMAKIPISTTQQALAEFSGVDRRMTVIGVSKNYIRVIDDYAHHPSEISAVLAAARTSKPDATIIAVFQPHRYSRVASLYQEFCTCFNDADHVLVADIYPAGEKPIAGIDRDGLAGSMRDHGHKGVEVLTASDQLAIRVNDLLGTQGGEVFCLGAGSISQWAHQLPQALDKLALSSKTVSLDQKVSR